MESLPLEILAMYPRVTRLLFHSSGEAEFTCVQNIEQMFLQDTEYALTEVRFYPRPDDGIVSGLQHTNFVPQLTINSEPFFATNTPVSDFGLVLPHIQMVMTINQRTIRSVRVSNQNGAIRDMNNQPLAMYAELVFRYSNTKLTN